MIKVSVLYPNNDDGKFDISYYCETHMPMVQQKLQPACRRIEVEQGLAGAEPGAPAHFIAMGHLFFDTVEAFQEAFGPHVETIMADIPNYTNIEPVIQISEVKI